MLGALHGADNVELRTGAAVTGLATRREEGDTRAVGVVLEGGSRITADHVVLATGGYAASRELVRELQPRHAEALIGCRDHATGDGHQMLRDLGVALTHTDTYVPTMGMIEDPDRPGHGLRLTEARVIVDAKQRRPWEIWVNERGERFVAEDTPSPFEREASLRRQPGLAMWVVWDRLAMQHGDPVIGPDWDRDPILKQAARGSWLRAYESIEGLAAGCELPLPALRRAIDEYNLAEEDRLGRDHRPLPIMTAPFYAIRVVGGMLLSRGGPVVDANLRPLDAEGRPIRSLHAIGELLGMGQFSGDSFAGGMSVGPALGLGRWIVDRIITGGG